MFIKGVLKILKTYEPAISTALGALVVLTIGVLVINYFRGREIQNLPPAAQTENIEEMSLPKKHIVEKGENLWKISVKYFGSGYNWVDLVKENNLTKPNFLSEGQELSIPNVDKKNLTLKDNHEKPSTTSVVQEKTITGETYQAIKGDSLWKIAVRKYSDGYKWVGIAKENKLKNPNLIFVDQELKLP